MRAAIRQVLFSQTPFHPRRLFAAGELGSVHIARDLDTLISTAAGSTPDVALNGYAGKWLDQSGLGNNATQSTSTARPQLSARVNLLIATEAIDSASWQKLALGTGVSAVVTQNAGTDPLGGDTAERCVFARGTTTSADRSYLQQSITGKTSTSYTLSVYAKRNAGTDQQALLYGNFGTGPFNVFTATQNWQRITATGSSTTVATFPFILGFFGASPAGVTASDMLLWGADLRLSSDSNLPYQRVVSATNYDSAGFPQYLAFDSDDALVATYPSSLGSACTVCIGRANTTPLILTGQTINTTYTLNAAVADRVTGLIVVNRALTALETAQVTAYLQARS